MTRFLGEFNNPVAISYSRFSQLISALHCTIGPFYAWCFSAKLRALLSLSATTELKGLSSIQLTSQPNGTANSFFLFMYFMIPSPFVRRLFKKNTDEFPWKYCYWVTISSCTSQACIHQWTAKNKRLKLKVKTFTVFYTSKHRTKW